MGNEKESSKVFENLLFPKIFRSFRIALNYKNMIIAFMAVAVVCLSGWIMDFSNTVVATTDQKGGVTKTELDVYIHSQTHLQAYMESADKDAGRTGVFSTLWRFAASRFHDAINSLFSFNIPGVILSIAECFKAVTWIVRYHFLYSVIFFVIALVVIAVSGGAICRIAALQFARNEKPGLSEALNFSLKKFTSFVTAPLAPVGIVILMCFLIFLLGLICNIPWISDLLMGVFMILALFAGFVIVYILIGAVVGFNLMFPAVAYDGSDCFDAMSRALSYVYAKPWRMVFYTAAAAVYGAICYVFVRLFAFLMLWFTHRSMQLGISNSKLAVIWSGPTLANLVDPPDWAAANWPQKIAAAQAYVFLLVVVLLVVSFIISFYFSANTIIYSLMRYKVDNTDLEDIYTPFEDIDSEPDTFESRPEESEPQPETETE